VSKPGRPPLDAHDRSIELSVSMPSKQLATVSDRAKQDRMTVQDWIRRAVRDASRENKSG
jgi:hypothetical protein